MKLTERERKSFSLTRAMQAAAQGGLSDSLEAEILREATEEAGREFTPHAFTVPWGLLKGRRDLNVAGAADLVGTETTQPVDLLRPVSLAVQAGIQVVPGQVGDASVPKASAGATAQWLTSELDAITPSDPTIAELSGSPHYAGAITVVSTLMRKQAIDGDFVDQHLLGLIGATLDAAVLAGSGANGEPQGILGLADVQTVTGTGLAHAGVTQMEQLSADQGVEPSGYLTTPGVRKLLKDREAASGSGFIWTGSTINGKPGFATTSCPAATMFCGPWGEVIVPLWGDGIAMAVDPSTHFATGRYQYRAMVGADVIVRHPDAFVTASSIT